MPHRALHVPHARDDGFVKHGGEGFRESLRLFPPESPPPSPFPPPPPRFPLGLAAATAVGLDGGDEEDWYTLSLATSGELMEWSYSSAVHFGRRYATTRRSNRSNGSDAAAAARVPGYGDSLARPVSGVPTVIHANLERATVDEQPAPRHARARVALFSASRARLPPRNRRRDRTESVAAGAKSKLSDVFDGFTAHPCSAKPRAPRREPFRRRSRRAHVQQIVRPTAQHAVLRGFIGRRRSRSLGTKSPCVDSRLA